MNVTRFLFNDIGGLSNFRGPRKDSMFASSITRTWKEEKMEEECRASKGVVYGALLGALLWCTMGVGVFILL